MLATAGLLSQGGQHGPTTTAIPADGQWNPNPGNGPRAAVGAASQPVHHPSHVRLVHDVILHADGLLLGRVARPCAPQAAPGDRPVRIDLFQSGDRVATAVAADDGSFSAAGLAGGIYQVAVSSNGDMAWSLLRVWTPTAAPPTAQPVASVWLPGAFEGGRSVAAVSKFPEGVWELGAQHASHFPEGHTPPGPSAPTEQGPALSGQYRIAGHSRLPEITRAQHRAARSVVVPAVTAAAIAAGAIAAPIIYKDAKRDSFIPATKDSPASP